MITYTDYEIISRKVNSYIMTERRDYHQHDGERDPFFASRYEKILALRELGINIYPDSFERTHISTEILSDPEVVGREVSVAGRISSIRNIGKLSFAHIQDFGGQIQILLRVDELGEDSLRLFRGYFDIGDFVGVKGEVFVTRTGETTVLTNNIGMLSKALRPPPEKYHGLKNREVILRQPYLDLLSNPESREKFVIRANVIKTIRNYLDNNGFIEVETPILQSESSGANAKPFITRYDALDADFYLRIAPETYLKRLLVGGYERVYEIGRNFRNEGVDSSHLQQFTMLEFYAAYWNAFANLNFTESLLREVIKRSTSDKTVKVEDKEFHWEDEWPRRTYRDVVLEHSGVDFYAVHGLDDLREKIAGTGISLPNADTMNLPQLMEKWFKLTTRPFLVEPQFIVEYPKDLSPLARESDSKPGFVDQFQFIVGGSEIVKGYSELIDPVEQRQRLLRQVELREEGDQETMPLDSDYLLAMEYGMPPNSGVGIGIDRLVAIITGSSSLRDVVLFPTVRPK